MAAMSAGSARPGTNTPCAGQQKLRIGGALRVQAPGGYPQQVAAPPSAGAPHPVGLLKQDPPAGQEGAGALHLAVQRVGQAHQQATAVGS